MELWDKGILGKQERSGSPASNASDSLKWASSKARMEMSRRDEDRARLENSEIQTSGQLPPPEFFDNHEIHYSVHTDELKSPEVENWDPQIRLGLIAHVILHSSSSIPHGAFQLSGIRTGRGWCRIPIRRCTPQGGPQGPPPGSGSATTWWSSASSGASSPRAWLRRCHLEVPPIQQ
jgi:hypothetical protein